MFKNLSAEMARYGVSTNDIRIAIGKSERATRDKLAGKVDFSFPEAAKIRDSFFPGMTLEYLFAVQ